MQVDPVAGQKAEAASSLLTNSKSAVSDPGTFRVLMEQMTNKNLSGLFSLTNGTDDNNNDTSSLLGGSSQTDTISGISGSLLPYTLQGSDPLASFLSASNQNNSDMFDMSFISPNIGLNEMQVNQTLSNLAKYSDLSETKKWAGVLVKYTDPATGLAKEGKIEKVLIENVQKPMFVANGDKFSLDDIKEIMSSELNTDQNKGNA
jgi:hypothetical protein